MWDRRIRQIAFLLFFLSGKSFAQGINETDEMVIQNAIEYLIENSENSLDYTDLQYRFAQYLDHPINLNKADFDKLSDLILLSEADIIAILQHRTEYGDFLSRIELQSVDGLDLGLIRILYPFVTVNEYIDDQKLTLYKILHQGDGTYFARNRRYLQKAVGYLGDDKAYLGSNYQLYQRFAYTYRQDFSIGFTTDKDPGEELFKGSQKHGFDYNSAHLYLKNIGHIKSLAIGDYQVQFGQGLVAWSGLAFNKSADVMNVARRAKGFSPYRAANENLFLRGAAISYQIGKVILSPYYSNKRIDANLVIDTLQDDFSSVTSFQVSGFHRTLSELEDRKTATERIAGCDVSLQLKKFKVGTTIQNAHLTPELVKGNKPYQQFNPYGEQLTNFSFHYNGIYKGVYLYGEAAYSDLYNALATVNGAIMSLHPHLDFSAVYRNYSPQYVSYLSNSFRESSSSQNEKGLYLALSYKPKAAWRFNVYIDQFKFPWLQFKASAPVRGYETLADLTYRPSKKFELYGRIKTQVRQENASNHDGVNEKLADKARTNIRFQMRYVFSDQFTFTTRVEKCHFKIDSVKTSKGILLYQDIDYSPSNLPLTFIARYAVFNISGFDARIYTYENDVLYAFSIPFFYQQGTRFYLLTRYRVSRRIDLWVKYSQTLLLNAESIGSGNDQIVGPFRSELKVQARIRF